MEVVKRRNRAFILSFISRSGPISRKDIAAELGLTPASVTQISSEFMNIGLLKELGTLEEEGRPGRKKVLVDINYEYRNLFAVNIETARTTVALTNLKGEAKAKRELKTDKNAAPEEFLARIADICREIQKEADVSKEQIAGAGVCIIGLVDPAKGISNHAYGIWNKPVPVAKILSGLLQVPVFLENNVSAFAQAEMLFGIGREKDHLLFVKWGPGVGSAIVTDKKVYEGRNGRAAELGHFIVEKNGALCSCGRRGCLETRVSYGALRRQLGSVMSETETPELFRLLEGSIENLNKEKLFQVLDHPDEKVRQILEERMDLFARTIVNCMTILAPNRVVLCGEMFQSETLRRKIIEACKYYDSRYDETKIVYTGLANREDYIGAAAHFISAYLYKE